MGDKYRTEPTKRVAVWNYPRDRELHPIMPRIVERRPRPGDVHPLTRRHIEAFLRRLPVDYVYGLKRVELRPRMSNEVGHPYGTYNNAEKRIVLYSVPPTVWKFAIAVPCTAEAGWWFALHGADVDVVPEGLEVRWTKPVDLAYFLYEVFLHELGHHWHNQYRHKRPHPHYYAAKESSANRHMAKLAKRSTFAVWHAIEASKTDAGRQQHNSK